MQASYNITDDKLHLVPDTRLSEDHYTQAKAANFVWWPGSKQFVAKWSPQAEDFALSFGIEIEDDDTPDDVDARVDRFANYAERAEASAESAGDYLAERANTERRRENALNAIARNLSEAEHWQSRIEASIRHAQRKERPDVVARRIKGLEADLRKFEKQVKWTQNHAICYNLTEYYMRDEAGEPVRNEAGKIRLDHEKIEAKHAPTRRWAERWIKHITDRLLYERAVLEAAGGIVADSKPLEIGGAIKGAWQNHGEWGVISKVNKATVEILVRTTGYTRESGYKEQGVWTSRAKVNKTEIKAVMTYAEVEAYDGYIYGVQPAITESVAEAVA